MIVQVSAPEVLDLRGLASPASLVVAAKATRYLSRGTRVSAHCDEASTRLDLPRWAEWFGHDIESTVEDPKFPGGLVVTLVIRKARHLPSSEQGAAKNRISR